MSVAASAGQVALQRGSAAFDYRASRARIVRRTEAGETPVVCSGCGTEVDVDGPSHSPRCRYFDVAGPVEVRTEGIHTAAGGLTAKEMERRHLEYLDGRPSKTGCAQCPDWGFEGTLAECRDAFEAHRASAHPGTKTSRGAAAVELERVRAEAARRAQQRVLHAADDAPVELDDEGASGFAHTDEDEQDRPAEADAQGTTTPSGVQDAEGADGATAADSRVSGAATTRRGPGRPRIPDDVILASLRELAGRIGRAPKTADVRNAGGPGLKAIERAFGSLKQAVAAAGIEVAPTLVSRERSAWTRESAIAAIHVWAAREGHPPSVHQSLGDPSLPSKRYADKHFGCWANLIEQAGFPRPTRGTRYMDSSGVTRGADGLVAPPGEEQPKRTAATADGSGAAGPAGPAADPDPVAAVLRDVEIELRAAIGRFAPMHSPHEGYAVIREELERELWAHVCENTGTGADARAEAVQVAAMACRYIIDLCDRAAA